MNVTRKDATITNTDDAFPGAFEVVLSAPTLDRDGDTLSPEDWKQPLPDHITFDSDHGMSVATTVGSGIPSIDPHTGNLVVSGTYSSLSRAQEVRTLVNEGHIRTTSVAFMTEKSTKDGKTKATRELLNGAFVAIPSNRDARVLSSKTATVPTPGDVFGKAGARNSMSDQAHMQAAHDSLVAAGAHCGPMDDTGAAEYATGGKSVDDAEVKDATVVLDDAEPITGEVEIDPAPVEDVAQESADEAAAAVDDTAAAAKSADDEDIELKFRLLMVQITSDATE